MYTSVLLFVCFRFRNKAQMDFVQCVTWNPVSYELTSCSWDGTLMCRAVTDADNSSKSPANAINMNDH